jgi:hypothetical protein
MRRAGRKQAAVRSARRSHVGGGSDFSARAPSPRGTGATHASSRQRSHASRLRHLRRRTPLARRSRSRPGALDAKPSPFTQGDEARLRENPVELQSIPEVAVKRVLRCAARG